jgi:molybdate transport system substrate-binding protein
MRIDVCSGNGMRAVLSRLAPQFERESGHTLHVSYDPAQIILRRVDQGESADVALLGDEAIDRLIARGLLLAETRRVLARNGIGVGVRAGAPRPDVATRDAFVRALRQAASIAYTSEGASGIYFAALIERLGIGEMVRAKARTQPGGLVGELVVAGQAEIAIQQVPELIAVPGLELAGPLPHEVQKINTTAGAVFSGSAARGEAASRLLDFLGGPAARDVFRASGFEPAA